MNTKNLSVRLRGALAPLVLSLMLSMSSHLLAQEAEPPVDTAPVAEESVAAEPTPPPVAEAPVAEAIVVADEVAEDIGPVVHKGDVTWMLVATLLVVMMAIPGLALFYGGLVRSKNILSVLMQVLTVFSLIVVLWAVYGYSLAFVGGNAWIGSFDALFLKGITTESLAETFTEGVALPELVFVAFQSTFAGLTAALIVGAYAERMKFLSALVFSVLWFTFCYLPVAHMVWAGGGYLYEKGALDFAGGTVVHINAGVAGLVAAYVVGKRLGYGREHLTPHNLVFTMVGACLLWVGWFGFNAGSNLEANSGTALAFINTLMATAAAVVAWSAAEGIVRGKASVLGGASGAVAGLVAITPACGSVGVMGAIAIGLVSGVVCFWGVTGLKKLLNVDDTADVFGVHGVGGIVGALLTGVFAAPSLGGTGGDDFSIAAQVAVQAEAVVITIVWSALVTFVALSLIKLVIGLRVSDDEQREGLDLTSHGESAYN